MSAELVEISKFKVDEETHAYFSALSQVTGQHINELMRQELQKIAAARIHVAKVTDAKLKAKGYAGILGDRL